MALKIVDEGSTKILNSFFKGTTPPTSFTLRLFCDSNALADADTSASHTAATGGGYADKTLAIASATVSSVGGIPQVAWAAQTFTFTGALTTNTTIKGYSILDNSGTVIVEELTTNFTPANNGDTYVVTPIIQLGNGTPT